LTDSETLFERKRGTIMSETQNGGPGEQEKKIIIDEDWKTQAEAEKERLEKAPKSAPEAGDAEADEGPIGELPKASVGLLVSQWATQAMIGLGEIPHPMSNKAQVDLGQAKLAIDMLEVLDTKTKGNLEPQEKQLLDQMLFELRMKYVSSTG
jgi:hypothetical protein